MCAQYHSFFRERLSHNAVRGRTMKLLERADQISVDDPARLSLQHTTLYVRLCVQTNITVIAYEVHVVVVLSILFVHDLNRHQNSRRGTHAHAFAPLQP